MITELTLTYSPRLDSWRVMANLPMPVALSLLAAAERSVDVEAHGFALVLRTLLTEHGFDLGETDAPAN